MADPPPHLSGWHHLLTASKGCFFCFKIRFEITISIPSVMDHNSTIGDFQESTVQNVEKYCPKVDSIVGYIEYSYDKQSEVLHGFYREVIKQKGTEIGIYVKGQKKPIFWKRLEGNAFMVGDGKNLTYIYPGILTDLKMKEIHM